MNEGNGQACPTIRVAVPTAAASPVNRAELVNETLDLTFAVQAVLPPGATLVGDMEARAIGAPRSVVTVDGHSKYGAWQ